MTRAKNAVAVPALLVLSGIVLAAVVAAGAAFLQWRATKIATLVPSPLTTIAPAQAPDYPPGLLLFGDSRIAMWEPLPKRNFPIHVAGYPGWTAIQLAPKFDAALARYRPTVVLVQLGVNDAVGASLVDTERREQAMNDTIAAIAHMADTTARHDIKLILLKVAPPIRPDLKRRILFGNRVETYVDEVNRAIDQLGMRDNVQVINPMSVLQMGDGAVPETFRKDSLHFTPEAYKAMNSLIPTMIGTSA